jgi:hypothetical protein
MAAAIAGSYRFIDTARQYGTEVTGRRRRPRLSLSQTSSGWLLTKNRAILLWDEGSL